MNSVIVTQSYKLDYEECVLLCESIDKFVPENIIHYIFVNDEDLQLFTSLGSKRRVILPKSLVLPQWLFRVPFKILGHHFHVSFLTIPVREWIIQQIVKLGVWEVLDPSIDVFFNIDSEGVFMNYFKEDTYWNDGRLRFYRVHNPQMPSRMDYFKAAKKLLYINESLSEISYYDYMVIPMGFRRDVLSSLCKMIGEKHWSGNWKIALMNTYRFSENYLYALYTSYIADKNMQKHFIVNNRTFLTLEYMNFFSEEAVRSKVIEILSNSEIQGITFQKKGSKYRDVRSLVSFSFIKQLVYEYWGRE